MNRSRFEEDYESKPVNVFGAAAATALGIGVGISGYRFHQMSKAAQILNQVKNSPNFTRSYLGIVSNMSQQDMSKHISDLQAIVRLKPKYPQVSLSGLQNAVGSYNIHSQYAIDSLDKALSNMVNASPTPIRAANSPSIYQIDTGAVLGRAFQAAGGYHTLNQTGKQAIIQRLTNAAQSSDAALRAELERIGRNRYTLTQQDITDFRQLIAIGSESTIDTALTYISKRGTLKYVADMANANFRQAQNQAVAAQQHFNTARQQIYPNQRAQMDPVLKGLLQQRSGLRKQYKQNYHVGLAELDVIRKKFQKDLSNVKQEHIKFLRKDAKKQRSLKYHQQQLADFNYQMDELRLKIKKNTPLKPKYQAQLKRLERGAKVINESIQKAKAHLKSPAYQANVKRRNAEIAEINKALRTVTRQNILNSVVFDMPFEIKLSGGRVVSADFSNVRKKIGSGAVLQHQIKDISDKIDQLYVNLHQNVANAADQMQQAVDLQWQQIGPRQVVMNKAGSANVKGSNAPFSIAYMLLEEQQNRMRIKDAVVQAQLDLAERIADPSLRRRDPISVHSRMSRGDINPIFLEKENYRYLPSNKIGGIFYNTKMQGKELILDDNMTVAEMQTKITKWTSDIYQDTSLTQEQREYMLSRLNSRLRGNANTYFSPPAPGHAEPFLAPKSVKLDEASPLLEAHFKKMGYGAQYQEMFKQEIVNLRSQLKQVDPTYEAVFYASGEGANKQIHSIVYESQSKDSPSIFVPLVNKARGMIDVAPMSLDSPVLAFASPGAITQNITDASGAMVAEKEILRVSMDFKILRELNIALQDRKYKDMNDLGDIAEKARQKHTHYSSSSKEPFGKATQDILIGTDAPGVNPLRGTVIASEMPITDYVGDHVRHLLTKGVVDVREASADFTPQNVEAMRRHVTGQAQDKSVGDKFGVMDDDSWVRRTAAGELIKPGMERIGRSGQMNALEYINLPGINREIFGETESLREYNKKIIAQGFGSGYTVAPTYRTLDVSNKLLTAINTRIDTEIATLMANRTPDSQQKIQLLVEAKNRIRDSLSKGHMGVVREEMQQLAHYEDVYIRSQQEFDINDINNKLKLLNADENAAFSLGGGNVLRGKKGSTLVLGEKPIQKSGGEFIYWFRFAHNTTESIEGAKVFDVGLGYARSTVRALERSDMDLIREVLMKQMNLDPRDILKLPIDNILNFQAITGGKDVGRFAGTFDVVGQTQYYDLFRNIMANDLAATPGVAPTRRNMVNILRRKYGFSGSQAVNLLSYADGTDLFTDTMEYTFKSDRQYVDKGLGLRDALQQILSPEAFKAFEETPWHMNRLAVSSTPTLFRNAAFSFQNMLELSRHLPETFADVMSKSPISIKDIGAFKLPFMAQAEGPGAAAVDAMLANNQDTVGIVRQVDETEFTAKVFQSNQAFREGYGQVRNLHDPDVADSVMYLRLNKSIQVGDMSMDVVPIPTNYMMSHSEVPIETDTGVGRTKRDTFLINFGQLLREGKYDEAGKYYTNAILGSTGGKEGIFRSFMSFQVQGSVVSQAAVSTELDATIRGLPTSRVATHVDGVEIADWITDFAKQKGKDVGQVTSGEITKALESASITWTDVNQLPEHQRKAFQLQPYEAMAPSGVEISGRTFESGPVGRRLAEDLVSGHILMLQDASQGVPQNRFMANPFMLGALLNREPTLNEMNTLSQRLFVNPNSTFSGIKTTLAGTFQMNLDFDYDILSLYLTDSKQAATELQQALNNEHLVSLLHQHNIVGGRDVGPGMEPYGPEAQAYEVDSYVDKRVKTISDLRSKMHQADLAQSILSEQILAIHATGEIHRTGQTTNFLVRISQGMHATPMDVFQRTLQTVNGQGGFDIPGLLKIRTEATKLLQAVPQEALTGGRKQGNVGALSLIESLRGNLEVIGERLLNPTTFSGQKSTNDYINEVWQMLRPYIIDNSKLPENEPVLLMPDPNKTGTAAPMYEYTASDGSTQYRIMESAPGVLTESGRDVIRMMALGQHQNKETREAFNALLRTSGELTETNVKGIMELLKSQGVGEDYSQAFGAWLRTTPGFVDTSFWGKAKRVSGPAAIGAAVAAGLGLMAMVSSPYQPDNRPQTYARHIQAPPGPDIGIPTDHKPTYQFVPPPAQSTARLMEDTQSRVTNIEITDNETSTNDIIESLARSIPGSSSGAVYNVSSSTPMTSQEYMKYQLRKAL